MMVERSTTRECGKCSLCCRLLKIVELNKPAGQWCKFCKPGRGGCTIHETRPQVCRGFFCAWMLSKDVSDDWYPLKCHMVMHLANLGGIQTVTVTVDPKYPEAWTKVPHYAQLKAMAERGLHVTQASEIFIVQVRVGNRLWLILPNADAEITTSSYVVKLTAKGEWGVELFKSEDEAAERVAILAPQDLGQHPSP